MEYNTLLFLLCIFVAVNGSPLKSCSGEYLAHPAVINFQRYIQIDTSKEYNLHRAVEFWRQQALELGLPFNVFHPGGLPVVVITLLGNDPSLPSILLNSHMDVVPAVEEEWEYPPFSGYMDKNGDIFGRGTQDDKDVSIQYLEAIRRLKQDNIVLNRTLHITLMPDEETGGYKGIKPFVKTEAFRALNVGFALDEGLTSTDDTLMASYQDKRPCQFQVTVYSQAGHGSSMTDNSAMEKAIRFINAVDAYRNEMKALMKTDDPLDFAKRDSINMNIIHGGYTTNIVPSSVKMVVDMRLASTTNASRVEQMVKDWVTLAGNGTELKYLRRDQVSKPTTLDNSNPYWVAMQDAVNQMGFKIIPVVIAGTSDMLVLRNMGIPAVGFSPKIRTTAKVHGKDEYLNVKTFLRGIDMYYEIFKKLANVPYFERNVTCEGERKTCYSPSSAHSDAETVDKLE